MKKLLLLFLTISFFSLTSNAQSNWTEVFNDRTVKVEMTTIECNPNDRMVPYTYSILRYTNLTSADLDFNFEIYLWYNNKPSDNSKKDAGDPEVLKTIHFSANETITGDCDSKIEFLRVFNSTNNPKVPTQLSKIEIVAK